MTNDCSSANDYRMFSIGGHAGDSIDTLDTVMLID